MKESAWLERCKKRELRVAYRTKRLEREQKGNHNYKDWLERDACEKKEIAEIFKADNKKPKKPDKKPGPGKFLVLYSYIPSTKYDTRFSIPPSWKPRSFNERNQHIEFLKRFVYPYPLPEALVWMTHSPEYTHERNISFKTPDFDFIRLAKTWIQEIVSGESFYKLNKKFFTKAEAHYFLTSKVPPVDGYSVLKHYSVIKLYFYAKCRGRSLNHKLSLMIADVLTVKFHAQFRNNLIEGFLDLLARTPEYRYESGMLGDLCDFVLDKIRENKNTKTTERAFSFSGRTIASVIALTNEWHERLRQEAEARYARWRVQEQTHKNTKSIDTSHWKGLGIPKFQYEATECIWTVTEIRTAQDLLNEGRKMKNCVASYAYDCASGESAIFSVERVYPVNQIVEKAATLEVLQSKRGLIQAKGKCNTELTPKIKNVVSRWAKENQIAVGLLV